MATNRDLLKEAIADAKAVKETAIANAKAALEEAFTPQLKSMFAAKLQEIEKEDLEEMYGMSEDEKELEEGGYDEEHYDPVTGKRVTVKDVTSEDLDEYRELQPSDVPKGMSGVKKDEEIDEIDLEELLRELELEEGDMEDLNEAEEDDDDDTNVSDEDSDEDDDEGEPIDLEDMTDEDLKTMIEDVIKDMITAGEIEAGHEGMKDEVGVEDEEEVDLAELLKEIEEMEDKKMYEEKESMDEGLGSDSLLGAAQGIPIVAALVGTAVALVANQYRKYKKDMKMSDEEAIKNAAKDKEFANSSEAKELNSDIKAAQNDLKAGPVKEESSEELAEAYKTIKALKSELNEINLLNAKLLYTNKIFKAKNLNESQKVKVLSSFDKATTVGEVKLVFETLNEGIKVAKNTIKENLGSASKATVTPGVKKPIVESNDAFLRMQKLAGII